jgi:hypothetical protein
VLDRRITQTSTVPPLRASSAREAAFAAWDESPVHDTYERESALRRTKSYLQRVLPGEGYALGDSLGSGAWGEVFRLEGSDLVVKVTLDPYEAGFARFLQSFRQGAPSYPRVHAIYKTPLGTYLIFREGLLRRADVPATPEVLAAADRALQQRLRLDLDVRHLDLHEGNVLYRLRGDRVEAVVGDLGLTTYPAASSIPEVNPKRNPMTLYPKPSSKKRVAVILAGFNDDLTNAAAQALRAELPDEAAELAESWPDAEDLIVMAPGEQRTEQVVVPILLTPTRGLVTRSQIRALLTEAREALDHYASAAKKRGRSIEVYAHTLGTDMGADLEDVSEDVAQILAAYKPTVVPVRRAAAPPRGERLGQLVAKIETALEEGDRRAAVRLLKSLKRTLYTEAKRSR